MTDRGTYSGDSGLAETVSKWLANRRAAARDQRQLAACCGSELDRLAQDIGVCSGAELLTLVGKGPGGADLLSELAAALGIELEQVRQADPRLVRDLEAGCCKCEDKSRCAHELRDGTASAHFAEFCPNAETLAGLRP